MDKKELTTYRNDFNRQNYDRIGLMLPKGMGEQWKEEAKKRGLSINAFVQEAVKNYLESEQ